MGSEIPENPPPYIVITLQQIWEALRAVDDVVDSIKSDLAVEKRRSDDADASLRELLADHEARLRKTEEKKRFETRDWLLVAAVVGATGLNTLLKAVGLG